MTQTALAADVVAVLSTVAKLGAVAQIRHNHSARSTAGLSRTREVTYLAAYAAWLWHGVVAGQMPEVVSGAVGGVLSLILLGQMGWYALRPATVCPLVALPAADHVEAA